jgi:hypothetical protein
MESYGFKAILVTPVAWAETSLKRVIFDIAAKLNLKAETGLVYIGQARK